MKRLFILIILLCVAAFGLGFAVLNTGDVHLDYYFGAVDLPLALAIVLAMLLGTVLGGMASLGMVVRHKRRSRQLEKRVKLTEKEIKNLREIPIKDRH